MKLKFGPKTIYHEAKWLTSIRVSVWASVSSKTWILTIILLSCQMPIYLSLVNIHYRLLEAIWLLVMIMQFYPVRDYLY